MKKYIQKTEIILISTLLSGCVPSYELLDADRECNAITTDKEEYRQCLYRKYEEHRQEVEDTVTKTVEVLKE